MTQEAFEKATEYDQCRKRFRIYLTRLNNLKSKTQEELKNLKKKNFCSDHLIWIPGMPISKYDRSQKVGDLFGSDGLCCSNSDDVPELLKELGWFNPESGLILNILEDLEKAIQKKIEYYDNKIKDL